MLNYFYFMRLFYGRLTGEGPPQDKDMGEAQVSASQQGMEFIHESVLAFSWDFNRQ